MYSLVKPKQIAFAKNQMEYVLDHSCVIQVDMGIKSSLQKTDLGTILIIDENDYILNKRNGKIIESLNKLPEITLDGYIEDDHFFIQDILQFENTDCTLLNFDERWSIVSNIQSFGDFISLAPIAFSTNRKNEMVRECIDTMSHLILKEIKFNYDDLKNRGYYSYDFSDFCIDSCFQDRFVVL